MSTYSLILREAKGSKLSIPEMDGNLLYLQDLALSATGSIGSEGPQGPRGFDGSNGDTGPQGINGDRYYATSSTILAVPDIGYIVEISTEPNLSYTSGQDVFISNVSDSFYVETGYDVDSDASGYFEGEIEWYDKITGTMSIVTNLSTDVGITYSFWYINLSGRPGSVFSTWSSPITEDPTTTTSTIGVMMGLSGSIRPVRSGSILIIISGYADTAANGAGGTIQLRYGTGIAPINGSALTGTSVQTTNYFNQNSEEIFPFSVNNIITGLTLNTSIWVDLSLASVGVGINTSRIRGINISIIEL